MSRQNDSDFPQSELDMIEQAMSSMMQGTVSMLFHSLFGPEQNSGFNSGIFENTSDMQQHQQHSAMLGGDGSDFKRLANKSRKNRGIPTTIEEQDTVQEHPASPPAAQPPPLPEPRRSAGMIIRDEPDLMNRRTDNDMARIATPPPTMMNLLQFMFGSHTGQMATPGGNNETGTLLDLMLPSDDQLFNSMEPEITGHPRQDMEGNPSQQEGMGWSFSSSSQRRVVQADGTEKTYITRTQNGVTETIKKIRYPDGSMEETVETGRNGNNHSGFLTGPAATALGYPTTPTNPTDPNQPNMGGPISSMWRRLFG